MSLKILHVVQSLEPGGMENGIVNMVSRLSGEELSFEICCLAQAGRMAQRLPEACPLHVLDKRPSFDRSLPGKLKKLVRTMRPDVLHTHNLGPLIYTVLARFGGMPGRILHGEHASLTQADLVFRKRLQRKVLYRFCTQIHTVGRAMTRQLDGLRFAPRPVITLQNGVDTGRFVPCPDKPALRRELLGLSGDVRLAGIFGRFGPYKRHAQLLEAFAEVAGKFPDLHLLVAGGGGELEQDVLARIRSHPFSLRIHPVGFLPDPLRHYQCLDLLVIPSANEGLSNGALEAMACGVPVLSNRNCGAEELITDGQDGVVREMSSTGELARHLARLLGPDGHDLQQLGTRARHKIVEQFSLDGMADAYRNAYRAVLPLRA